MTPEIISQIKKLFIFLREQDEYMEDSLEKMREIMIKTFAAYPDSLIIKEFFSFLREIFYYNKMMDNVDFELTKDILETMNQIIKESPIPRDINYMQIKLTDYYYSSNITQGFTVIDPFFMPTENFHVSMLFKLSKSQIYEEMDRRKCKSLDMVLYCFKDVTEQN